MRINRSEMTELLYETEKEHAEAEKRLPQHDWQVWYGAYMSERLTMGVAASRDYADARVRRWLRMKEVFGEQAAHSV